MGKILKMDFRRLLKDPFFYAYPFSVIAIMIIVMITSKTDPEDSVHIDMILEQAESVLYFAIVSAGIVVISQNILIRNQRIWRLTPYKRTGYPVKNGIRE